ncbi:MAG: nucleotide exchange factor GrpE [Desulfobacterales bacterium]|jgi:molecular chaperone GrpE
MSQKKKIKIQTEPNEEESKLGNTGKASLAEAKVDKAEEIDTNDSVKDLEDKLHSKEEEVKETYERLLRVSAEFENYKKRSAREMEEFRKFANQSLIKEMLSVVDNLELAMNSTDSQKAVDKGVVEGLEMTHREILKVFERFNVKPIDAKNQAFDPSFHEAVMQEETDEFPENTVINEMQKGYLIHDRLLRPAMVVVAKPKAGQKQEPDEKKK